MKHGIVVDGQTPVRKQERSPSPRCQRRDPALSFLLSALVLALLYPAALPQSQSTLDLSCLANDEGVLHGSCFRWVSVIIDDQKQFDWDRMPRKQVREEYARAYEELSGAKKERVRKECAHDDEALRGFCFGYWTCSEVGMPECEAVKKVYSGYWDCLKAGKPECESVKNSYEKSAASDEHACHGVLALRKGGESLKLLLERKSKDKESSVENEYETAYEGLGSGLKERISNKCCGKEDAGIRVLCFLYETCLEVELPWCPELKDILSGSFSGGTDDPAIVKEKVAQAIEKMNAYTSPISNGIGGHTLADKKRRNQRGGRVPPPPCIDLNPNCPSWARDGECILSSDYMNSNCPLSCDRCNLALTPLHHGVEQQKGFPDLSIAGQDGALAVKTTYTDKGELKEPTKRKRTSTYLGTRVREVLVAMDAYLESETIKGAVVPQTCSNRHSSCALWAARGLCVKWPTMRAVCPAVCHACERLPIMVDNDNISSYASPHWSTAFERMDILGIFEAIEEDRLILPEGFEMKVAKSSEPLKLIRRENVNNVPLRQFGFMVYRLEPSKDALVRVRQRRRWAQRGILPLTLLEEQRRKVKKIGREIISIKTRKEINTMKSEQMMADANELAGKMERNVGADERERIAKEREEILGNLKVLQKQSSILANEMQEILESQRLLLKQSIENKSQLKKEATVESGSSTSEGWGKDYADGPIIARFDKFLSPTECRELLSLTQIDNRELANGVTSQILPYSEPIGEDGFGKSSMEMMTEGGMSRPVRISSRIFVDITSPAQQKEDQQQNRSGQTINSPIVQRLLSKIEMISSVPGNTHAEVPILFEKFGQGDFEGPKPHFSDVSSLPVTSESGKNKDDVGNTPHPMAMQNARILKLIIFLSDVEEGGEIAFPGMGNFAIEPLAGRALLVPSVLSLVGEKEDEVGLSLVDDPVISAEPNKGDGTCLVEDMDTISEHRRVEEGVKYTLTVWLRRYPVR